MAEYKYFFNDRPISEQEWHEIVGMDADTVEITESNMAEEQLSLF